MSFCSNDDLRPAMTGVHLSMGPLGTEAVATDGHRLARLQSATLTGLRATTGIIPYGVIKALLAVMPPDTWNTTITVEFSHTLARFTWPSHEVQCRLIDERYPDYEHILSNSLRDCDKLLVLDRRLLLAVLNRVQQFTNRVTHQIRFEINLNRLDIFGYDFDYDVSCREGIDINATPLDMLTIGYNAKLLIHLLKQIKADKVQFRFQAANKAALILPVVDNRPDENALFLMMPVMLNTYD